MGEITPEWEALQALYMAQDGKTYRLFATVRGTETRFGLTRVNFSHDSAQYRD